MPERDPHDQRRRQPGQPATQRRPDRAAPRRRLDRPAQRRRLDRPAQRQRLDRPLSRRRRLELDPEVFGRISERIARLLGTGKFLLWQTVLVIAWITLNLFAVRLRWDPYPFILLNLVFSTQAAYAAPLILLAQNRQDDRDRIALEEDRARAARTKEDTEYLARELAAVRLALGEVVTRDFLRDLMRTELERMRREAVGSRTGG